MVKFIPARKPKTIMNIAGVIKKSGVGREFFYDYIICVFYQFRTRVHMAVKCIFAQKLQQDAFGGEYKSELMISILLIAMVLTIPAILLKERREAAFSIKQGWYLALLIGICNGILNFFVMILTQIMPASTLYPMTSAGGIIMTWIFAHFLYKEQFGRANSRFSYWNWLCSTFEPVN